VIVTKWVFQNKQDQDGIVVRNKRDLRLSIDSVQRVQLYPHRE
jgi:hypothetical protein